VVLGWFLQFITTILQKSKNPILKKIEKKHIPKTGQKSQIFHGLGFSSFTKTTGSFFKSFEITGADGGGSLILIFSKNRRFSDSQNFFQLQNPKP
jgi:hypothetical protein